MRVCNGSFHLGLRGCNVWWRLPGPSEGACITGPTALPDISEDRGNNNMIAVIVIVIMSAKCPLRIHPATAKASLAVKSRCCKPQRFVRRSVTTMTATSTSNSVRACCGCGVVVVSLWIVPHCACCRLCCCCRTAAV